MNILWVTNVPLPEASLLMEERPLPFGGWLINTATLLAAEKNISLKIAFPKKGISEGLTLKGEHICYYPFPIEAYKSSMGTEDSQYLKRIIEKVSPDLVHIFGTESSHSLAIVNICSEKNIPCVISIQGLVSFIAKHYTNGLPLLVQYKYTIRDLIKLENIKKQQKKFAHRGEYEKEALRKVKHIIGRTTWDYTCTRLINPNSNYYYCNETLRNEFYNHTWKFDHCEKYSIFLSQGSYPIKGLHFMLEAMPLIIKRFPQTKLYIGGQDITNIEGLKGRLRVTGYAKYIRSLVRKNNLQSRVIFTNPLDEIQMCMRLKKSHVFVCPSTIENSPNSLGEAMMLGVPSVVANVGGIPDILTHNKEGYIYQGDAPYMLAHYICEVFENREVAEGFSIKAKERARNLYNKEQNHKRLLEIYNEVNSPKEICRERESFEEKISFYQ